MLVSAAIDHRPALRRTSAPSSSTRSTPSPATTGAGTCWPLLAADRPARGPGPPAGRPVGDGGQPGRAARLALGRLRRGPGGSSGPPAVPEPPPEVQLDYVGHLDNAATVIAAPAPGREAAGLLRQPVAGRAARRRSCASGGSRRSSRTARSGLDERRQAEQAFAEGRDCVIVATSALELGIDVGDLDRVIQIDAPAPVSSFLQRMGRTGRRPGTARNCLFLATSRRGACSGPPAWSSCGPRATSSRPCRRPSRYHILAQQLMALALQERGIGRSEWLDWVGAVPAFRDGGARRRRADRRRHDRDGGPLGRGGRALAGPRGRGRRTAARTSST